MEYKKDQLFVDYSLETTISANNDDLNEYIFYADKDGELLKISKEGFFYKGKK